MNHTNKGKAKIFSAWLCSTLILILTFSINSIGFNNYNFHIHLTADTTPVKISPALNKPDSAIKINNVINDSTGNPADTIPQNQSDTSITNTIDTLLYNISKSGLDVPVKYHADDSMVMDIPKKNIKLYGKKSSVKYTDIDLESPEIEYDQNSNLVKAHLTKDSTGKVIGLVKFSQADFKSESDTIVFNMKTQKGLTKGTYTEQGEMYVYGEAIKKESDDVFYALKGRFTTCELDTPHFAFVSNKIKFINKKMAFTGPVHPEFEGVPIPVVLPFGIYPLSQGRHSGLIAPTFTANAQLGFALDGLGYYKVLNQSWDATIRGTIYSYGSWTLNLSPRYFKRYRYQGNFGFDVQNIKTNFEGDPDYSKSQTYQVRWSHSMDNKARPGVTFSANVNFGSTQFNSQVPNSPQVNFTNRINSAVTYAKVWKDKPYNIGINANHSQNSVTGETNFSLPDINFNLNTIYPFRRKEPIGEYKWYENLGIALNTNAKSLSSFYDTAGNIGTQISDNLQWGGITNVPISLSLPSLGPVQIAPTVTLQERWYQQEVYLNWDTAKDKMDTTIKKGFYRASEMAFGISASTRIFGMFTFNKGRVKAIRHEIRPSISANYKPNWNSYSYYTEQVDTFGNTQRFSWYTGSIFGPFSEGEFGGLSFAIDNNLTMKVRSKTDTSAEGLKKVSLLDGFGIGGSYNFLADSFKMSSLNIYARSNLFNKINITGSANFYPYQTDSVGNFENKLIWEQKPISLGTLTGGQISLQTSFKGGDKSKKATPENINMNQQNTYNSGMPGDEYQQELAYMNNNPGEFVDFEIPWDISFSYSLLFNRVQNSNFQGYKTEINQSVNWNASVNLAPKWKAGVTGFYNLTTGELGTISIFLSREMHCWQLAINLSPVGKYRFFNISISPKAPMLRDLKVNRTRSYVGL